MSSAAIYGIIFMRVFTAGGQQAVFMPLRWKWVPGYGYAKAPCIIFTSWLVSSAFAASAAAHHAAAFDFVRLPLPRCSLSAQVDRLAASAAFGLSATSHAALVCIRALAETGCYCAGCPGIRALGRFCADAGSLSRQQQNEYAGSARYALS